MPAAISIIENPNPLHSLCRARNQGTGELLTEPGKESIVFQLCVSSKTNFPQNSSFLHCPDVHVCQLFPLQARCAVAQTRSKHSWLLSYIPPDLDLIEVHQRSLSRSASCLGGGKRKKNKTKTVSDTLENPSLPCSLQHQVAVPAPGLTARLVVLLARILQV